MDRLPAEVVLHILHFLPIPSITHLNATSKRYHEITSDNKFWRQRCFEDSSTCVQLSRATRSRPIPERRALELQRAIARSNTNRSPYSLDVEGGIPEWSTGRSASDKPTASLSRSDLAGCVETSTVSREPVDWYSEYIARHAPLSLQWLGQPKGKLYGGDEDFECKGLGLLNDTKALAPVEDGSICFWNLNKDTENYGKITARSGPGLLCADKENRTARLPSTGIVECVSIDRIRNKAYFAVHAGLAEVDLTTLEVASYSEYPQPISVLSEAVESTLLTVGTTQALHIYDPRVGQHHKTPSTYIGEHMLSNSDFCRINTSDPDSAVLSQPLPLSLLHAGENMIHVAGRFPSILSYDRRLFPRLTSAVHSGSRLSCITSFLSATGKTLAAVGEYNGKGSLELYPLSAASWMPTNTAFRNRTTAARSKCLSLACQGERLLFSDSDGMLKWIEKDGSTLVRSWNINTYSSPGLDMSEPVVPLNGIFTAGIIEGDVARKILPLSGKANSDVLVWTGEQVGVASFGSTKTKASKRRRSEGRDDNNFDPVSLCTEEKEYGGMMRRALERQADEARFVRGLGLGRFP